MQSLINALKELLNIKTLEQPKVEQTLVDMEEKWKVTLERIDALEKLLLEKQIINDSRATNS